MKKELTKEIVFAYLPHDVQVVWGNSSIPESLRPANFPSDWHVSKNFRLCLRPLSDLTKPITHNGREIDPLHEIGDALNDENLGYPDHYIDYINPENSGKDIDWLSEPWFIVQQLLEWHFDVFGLEADNLCVYMNPDGTITK